MNRTIDEMKRNTQEMHDIAAQIKATTDETVRSLKVNGHAAIARLTSKSEKH